MSCDWPIDRSCLPPLPELSASPTPEEQTDYNLALLRRNNAEDIAVHVLWALSGRQFGACETTVRPWPGIGGDMSIENLTNNANSGQLALHIDDEAFRELIKACDTYIDQLNDLHTQATDLSYHPLGFSEDHLDSGKELAKKFQEKAGAPENSAAAFKPGDGH